ncbi:MAG TPA: hypothetical protein VF352_03010, partial [Anaerolineales bacterium]
MWGERIILPLFLITSALSAGVPGGEAGVTASTQVPRPRPPPPPLPERQLIICLGQEPVSLYTVDNPSLAADSV